jgi:beta-N-acetylhexosaminidase
MTAMTGTRPSRSLLARARRGEVGGVILFGANIRSSSQTRRLIASLQRAAARGSNPPLLVATDQEGGSVKRFPSFPPDSSAAAMGTDSAAAEREGGRTGRALGAVGVTVDLAPVSDVPHMPGHFLGSRAFSRSVQRAASAAGAFARGLQATRVAATAKHFPGLGYARANTDGASVTIRARRRDLRFDYRPFRKLSQAGTKLVMLSNAAYTSLDRSRLPASMSRRIVGTELRRIVGFSGVTISDSLASPAIQRVADPYVKVANAGTDILLFASEAESARGFARLASATRSGSLDRSITSSSAARVRALKRWLAPAAAQARVPSRRRLAAYVRPLRPRVGDGATVRVVDRWGRGGVGGRACLRPPGGADECNDFDIARGRRRALTRFDVPRSGQWTLVLTTRWGQRLRRRVEVRPRGEPLRLLATGDSMIQYVDTSLASRLEPGVRVRSDARVSTGISKPFLLDWVRHARSQAARYRPDVTVVFIGANDGFPLRRRAGGKKVRCCGRAWIAGYAARAHRMMATYARRGRGQVFWLTLPAARDRQWRRIYPAVNAALRRGARGFGDEIQLVDLGRVFTPHGRFRRTMRRHGRTVVVRQGDGVHLSPAGAGIAAEIIASRLRRGGLVD